MLRRPELKWESLISYANSRIPGATLENVRMHKTFKTLKADDFGLVLDGRKKIV